MEKYEAMGTVRVLNRLPFSRHCNFRHKRLTLLNYTGR